jgi:signal transduction histidine kinase
MGKATTKADYDALASSWAQRAPFFRRLFARIGLQGKLILCFFLLIAVCSGLSSVLFTRQSAQQLNDIMGEQAQQLCSALALGTEDDIDNARWDQLTRMAGDLIRSRDILFVGFLNKDFQTRALASRDLDFRMPDLGIDGSDVAALMRVRSKHSPIFGDYLEVFAPVFSIPERGKTDEAPAPGARLIGYVAVGVSQTRELAQLSRINIMVIGASCLVVLLSLPLAVVLVHRIFQPIRELVDATRKITGGDLETQVAIYRPDVIGMLARSFNDMVLWVRNQQNDLECVNRQLAEANADLEKRIEQRTAQLETANKRLSSEIAEKEDFLRAVSHDLNAPLRNISGMATMLLMKHREKFDNDIIHRLERIQKNVEIETDLIGELLELSRIKTRRQKLEPADINALVADLRDVFENDLKSRGIELILDTPLPSLVCECARVRQVFQNLIDNAIKYMGEGKGGREIHVGCQMRLTEVEFYVRDTGIGIDADDLDKVFFVFRRGKNSQLANIAGKGVGLASVKSIIETYNGKIWVESKLGEGSTFRFTINARFLPTNYKVEEEEEVVLN